MRWSIIGFAVLVLALGGCDSDGGEKAAEAVDTVEEADSGDDLADYTKSENWPDDIDRIVSMAPNVTEILFELGLGHKVVAVTRYCDWPEEAEERATIGGMLDPDFEAIMGAEPDVIVGAQDGADQAVADKLEQAGIEYGFVIADDLASVRRAIEHLSRWLDVEDRGAEILADFDAELDAATQKVRDSFVGDGATALLVYDREPVVAAGPGSFGHELLELAGLTNAVGDESGAYPLLDIEKILSLDPAVIIDVKIEADGAVAHHYWNQFDSLDAVQQSQVFHIDDPVMMRPGPRIPIALERLGEAIETP